MSIDAYLFFSDGTCAEAFNRYQEIFGGELTIMLMKDVPEDQRMPGSTDETVMHAALKFGDTLLMGSDDTTGDGGPRRGIALSYTASDLEAAGTVFAGLSEGGEVQMPLGPTFWSEGFGMCLDKYGVPWIVDTAAASDG
ncbi:VOC family protein [Brevibacterium permense]|uniref:VOC family protein n=1 Tax=Brevibacterium permense TaxID=234834 RepID=UPI0021CF4E2D|nr:VOC family protein [Brevibacterium permense]MCU4298578.1 VOC family protein [Brevibacterium permense]